MLTKTAPAPETDLTMRAVVLTGHGGIDRLSYREDVPVPQPQAGEVLIRVGACGMNNTDINTRTAWYNRGSNTDLSETVGLRGVEGEKGGPVSDTSSWNTAAVQFPRIQGAAIAGRIEGVGEGVDKGRMGKRVLVDPCVRDLFLPVRVQLVAYLGSERDGGYAEYVCVPTGNAYEVETTMTDIELATFPCSYDTAEEMLERARLGYGETVVVTGAAGGVGTALIQLSRIRGARVVAIAGKAKEERIRSLGAHEFVARENGDVRAAVDKLIGEQGAQVVADVVGGPIFGDLLKMLSRGGRYVTAGAIGGPVQPMDLRDLIYKDLEFYGITCPTAETFARVVRHIQSNSLKPVLEKSFPLKDLAEAQTLFLKRSHFGKYVIDAS